MSLMSKTGFSSAYDEGKGAYMHPVFFFLFQEIFNFHISTASNSSELLSEIKQILQSRTKLLRKLHICGQFF